MPPCVLRSPRFFASRLPAGRGRGAIAGGSQLAELLDVRAEDEAAALARFDDDPATSEALDLAQLAPELGEYLRRQRVGGRAGAVKRQPADGLLIDLAAPVFRLRAHCCRYAATRAPRSTSKSQINGK